MPGTSSATMIFAVSSAWGEPARSGGVRSQAASSRSPSAVIQYPGGRLPAPASPDTSSPSRSSRCSAADTWSASGGRTSPGLAASSSPSCGPHLGPALSSASRAYRVLITITRPGTALLNRLARDSRWFTAGQQPAGHRRDERHADHDDQEIGHRDVPEGRQAVERVAAGKGDRGDVRGHRAHDRAEQAERAGGGGGEHPPGRAAGPGGGQGAQVAGRFAADKADGHGEDGQREEDPEGRGPVDDLRGGRDAGLGLDAHTGRG